MRRQTIWIFCLFYAAFCQAHDVNYMYGGGDPTQLQHTHQNDPDYDPRYNIASNEVSFSKDSNYLYITANGIPYWHGEFPNAGNPNSISAQNYRFRVPLKPQLANASTHLQGFMVFGVGIDGVPFDPGTAEFWHRDPNWSYEAMSGKINLGIDANNAHVQPDGAYHYHALPTELTRGQSSEVHSQVIGIAADGFPIYARYGYVDPGNQSAGVKELISSWRLKPGNRQSGPGGAYDGTFTQDYEYVSGSGDLDECNGRFGITPDYPNGTYAYFITMQFPLISRCFKGTPDRSFIKQQQQGGGMRGQGGQGGPGGQRGQGRGGPGMGFPGMGPPPQ